MSELEIRTDVSIAVGQAAGKVVLAVVDDTGVVLHEGHIEPCDIFDFICAVLRAHDDAIKWTVRQI